MAYVKTILGKTYKIYEDVFVSEETDKGAERQGREKKKLTFAILSFVHVLYIQKIFLNSKCKKKYKI